MDKSTKRVFTYNNTPFTFSKCASARDEERCLNYALDTRHEYFIPVTEDALRKVHNYIVDHGNYYYIEMDGKIVFMITYTMGTLANNFEDKDTCYVYLCTISPELRRSKLFLIGLLLAFNDISHLDFSTILFKGYEGYEYTTKLYMKLAQIIETAKNHQGLDCHLFSTTKEHLEFYFKRYISRLKLEF